MTDARLRIALAATTALAALLFVTDLGGPVRLAVVVLFVLFCPGLAWSRLLRLGDQADAVALGAALSIAAAVVVAQVMALTGWWSPGTGLVALAALTLGGLAIPVADTQDSDEDGAGAAASHGDARRPGPAAGSRSGGSGPGLSRRSRP